MPPSLTDWLPEDHLVWTVLGAVDQMDLDGFYGAYRANRQSRAAYDPRMMARTQPVLATVVGNARIRIPPEASGYAAVVAQVAAGFDDRPGQLLRAMNAAASPSSGLTNTMSSGRRRGTSVASTTKGCASISGKPWTCRSAKRRNVPGRARLS